MTAKAISNTAPVQPSPDPRSLRVAARPRKNGTNPMRARAKSQALAPAANRWCAMSCTDPARSSELTVIWETKTTAKMIRADAANPKMAAIRGRIGSNVRWSSAFMGSSLSPYFLPIIDFCLLLRSRPAAGFYAGLSGPQHRQQRKGQDGSGDDQGYVEAIFDIQQALHIHADVAV